LPVQWFELGACVIVNTNLSALNAQRTLFENTKAASTVLERLATGSKINKAQDDVAGSAIADRMTAQVRGLNMAVKNANDALSLLDTADAIFIDQTNLTQRIRELALQAANNTNSIKDREYLQSEVTSLVAEMDRVPTQTTFNDAPVGGSKKFQIGADAGQSITTYISTHSGHSGTTYGQSTQDYSAGSTIIEVKGLSTSGPFAFGDMVIAGLPESGAYFVQGVSSALMHDDGTFTQTISLAGTGLNKSISADMEFVTAIGTIDLTLVDDPSTTQNEQFTLGGRGSLKRIDLVNNASGALSGIDSALQSLSNSRATVGASKNRINYIISNLMNISEQTTISRSRIEDADFATESAALAKTQVLQQTATAMLAQANASPRLVLQLVK